MQIHCPVSGGRYAEFLFECPEKDGIITKAVFLIYLADRPAGPDFIRASFQPFFCDIAVDTHSRSVQKDMGNVGTGKKEPAAKGFQTQIFIQIGFDILHHDLNRIFLLSECLRMIMFMNKTGEGQDQITDTYTGKVITAIALRAVFLDQPQDLRLNQGILIFSKMVNIHTGLSLLSHIAESFHAGTQFPEISSRNPEDITAVGFLTVFRHCPVQCVWRHHDSIAVGKGKSFAFDFHFDLSGNREIEFIIIMTVFSDTLKMRIAVIKDFVILFPHVLTAVKVGTVLFFHNFKLAQNLQCNQQIAQCKSNRFQPTIEIDKKRKRRTFMKMTLRWYGSKFDTVTLEQIRQIQGVTGVITMLYDKQPGDLWTKEEIRALKNEVEAAGLKIEGIESVNVSDAIKTGSADRDKDIETYIECLRNLGEEDIHLVCYNFMPVFDWTRTELARKRADGSTVLAYTQEAVDSIDPEQMFDSIASDMNGTVMPGWEPERMARVKELFELYKDIDNEKLFANLVYFLEKIMPVCNEYDIRMAIHPDDPAWSVFGLPRIIINKENILRLMKAVDDVHNGVTFCSGSYGTNLNNDLPDMIRSLKGRIHFAHVRNLYFHSPTNFEEAAHLSSDGTFDMYEIVKALYDIGFEGPIRPDHGRMIWGEVAMPGYGLYDRALGAAYINGLWEAIDKASTRGI